MSALLTKRPRLLLRAPASIASTMVSVAKTLQIPVYDVAVMIAGRPTSPPELERYETLCFSFLKNDTELSLTLASSFITHYDATNGSILESFFMSVRHARVCHTKDVKDVKRV